MAEYYATAVWFENHDKDTISYLALQSSSEGIGPAYKKSKEEVIELLTEHSVFTAQWDYESDIWVRGAQVHVVDNKNGKFLRTNPANTEKDNLGHLLPGSNLKIG